MTSRVCGRKRKDGTKCPFKVKGDAPACRFHLRPEERAAAGLDTVPRRMTPSELERRVSGSSRNGAAASPEDAQIVLAALRLYSHRVVALTEELARNLS